MNEDLGGLEPATIDEGQLAPPESPAPSPAPTAKPDRVSLDDALASAIKGEEEAAAAPDDGRARDELGRFTKPEAKAPEAEKEPATEEPPQEATQETQQQPTGDLPAAWRKPERSALWASLSPEARTAIAAREEEVSRGFAQYEGIGPYIRMASEKGTTVPKALDNYLSAERFLEQDPVNALHWLAGNYGVEIEVKGAAPNQPQQPLPPQMIQIQERLHRVENSMQADTRARSEAEVSAFAADPANKFFEDVADEIVGLIKSKQARTLKEAYETAIWLNPTTRAKLLAEREARTTAQKTAAEAAQRAKVAARSVATSVPAASNGAPRKVSLDDALSEAIKSATSEY